MTLRPHRRRFRRRRLGSIHTIRSRRGWKKNEKTKIHTPVYYIYTLLKKCGTRTHKNKNSLHVLFPKLVRRENCLLSFIIFHFIFSISVIVVLCLVHPPPLALFLLDLPSATGERTDGRIDGQTDGRTREHCNGVCY